MYVDAIRQISITFGVGPGTGKTWQFTLGAFFLKIMMSGGLIPRPAVEAGENGFSRGICRGKVNPYLRLLFDGLLDMFGPEEFIEEAAAERPD